MFEDYEQMNFGHIQSYISKSKKNKYCTKKSIVISLFLLSIIFFILYLKFKPSKTSSSSSTPENNNNILENEVDILTKKVEELKNENAKLFSQKESLQKENDNLNQQIKELTEQNKQKNDNSKEISEKREKIKDFEKKIKKSKDKLDELKNKQKKLNDKLTDNNTQVKNLEEKIENLEKELNDESTNDKKEEEKEDNKDDKKEEDNNDKKEEEDENKKDSDKSDDNDNQEKKSDEPNPNLKSRIDSKIINDIKYLELLDNWFKQKLQYKLLYRTSEEQYSAQIFHSKVDSFKNTIIFIKDINNFIYGGFTRKTWDGNRMFKNDQNAIVFNLDKGIYYKINDANHAIFCDPEYLAIFGEGDISLGPKSIETSFPKTYGSSSENKQYELTMGFNKLSPLEMEVFQLS